MFSGPFLGCQYCFSIDTVQWMSFVILGQEGQPGKKEKKPENRKSTRPAYLRTGKLHYITFLFVGLDRL